MQTMMEQFQNVPVVRQRKDGMIELIIKYWLEVGFGILMACVGRI